MTCPMSVTGASGKVGAELATLAPFVAKNLDNRAREDAS